MYVFQFFMEIRIRPIVIINLKLLDFCLKGNLNPSKCPSIHVASCLVIVFVGWLLDTMIREMDKNRVYF